MSQSNHEEQHQMIKSMLLGSIISADNDKYTEDVKQEVIRRIKIDKNNINYILEPLGEEAHYYLELLNAV